MKVQLKLSVPRLARRAGMSVSAKIFSVLRAPRVSEKTARLQEVSNHYVFEISSDATKADVKAAVEQLGLDFLVLDVRTHA